MPIYQLGYDKTFEWINFYNPEDILNPENKEIPAWIQLHGLQSPTSSKLESNIKIARKKKLVNTQKQNNDSASDSKRIASHETQHQSRTREFEDYAPLDMSKSTIVNSDGEQYEELYHGGWGLGYGIENPAAADDHRSIFLVDKLPVAKS